MENKIIDVEYVDMVNKSNKTSEVTDMSISSEGAVLGSELLKSLTNVTNNITNAIRDYKMCSEQEKTKRAEIKMQLQLGLAEIYANQEILLKKLNDEQEKNINHINYVHQLAVKEIDKTIDTIDTAIESAKLNNDFSQVIDLLQVLEQFTASRSKFELELMERTSNKGDTYHIDCPSIRGYLE